MESRRLGTSALLMMASNAISHGCFLLIAVVLARSLAVRDFGTFNQVWLVNQSLVYVFALGLPVSVYYFLPRLPDAKRKAFILQTLASLTILALPLSLSMYLLADRLAIYFNNPGLAHYFRIFAIYPLLAFPAISTDAILIGLDRTERAALFETVTKATMLAAVAAAGVLTHNLDVVFKALIGYAVAQALLGAWLVWSPVRRLTFHFAAADWKAQIAYAAPYGLGTLVGALNYQVDKILVSLFYPPAVFAVYAAGAFEIPLAGVAALPVVSVMMGELSRKFAAGDVQGFLRLWHQSMLRLAVPVFAVAAFLMVIAGPVVVTLFSAEYSASVGLFRIYLLFLLLRITVLEQVLAALGDTRFVFKAQAVALLVNLTLGYLLIRRSGWFGPALSAVFAGYLFGMLIILRIRHHLGVDVRRLIPWQALGRIALVAILAAGCAAAAFLLETRALWQVGAAGLLFTTVYLIGNLRTQAITTDDLRTAWGWARTAAGAFTRGEGLEHEARK